MAKKATKSWKAREKTKTKKKLHGDEAAHDGLDPTYYFRDFLCRKTSSALIGLNDWFL